MSGETWATLLFGATAAAYTLAAVCHIIAVFRGDWDGLARWTTRVTWVIQTIGLLVLIGLTGRFPVYSLFEASYAFSWLLTGNYLAIELFAKNQASGAALVPITALLAILAVGVPKPTHEALLGHSLPASLVVWHVSVTLVGYALFVAAAVSSMLYIVQEEQLRRKRFLPLYHRLPALEALDRWSGRFIAVGLPVLTVGLAAGVTFAYITWDGHWYADPKVIFTGLTWLLYVGLLLARRMLGLQGRRAAWWAIAGLTGILVNYFVVNVFFSNFHRFGA
jgi:HemX protein